MELKQLQKDMMAAMKAKDKVRKEAISSVYSAAKKAAIDKGVRDDVPGDLVDSVILKELKSIQEQIDTCPADRTDLLDAYKARYDIISEYAPKLMSADEIKAVLQEKYSDVLSTGNMGQIMKSIMPELKGKADGKLINQCVRELIQ